MDGCIRYRHNTMTVQSPETFVNIRGGCCNGTRDVYFIRVLGERTGMETLVRDLDRRLDAAAEEKRLLYRRMSGLPVMSSRDDAAFYAQSYSAWASGGAPALRTQCRDPKFANVLSAALKAVLELFRQTRTVCTDTIAKNYAVKLLFWTDEVLRDMIPQWTERLSVKLIADNIAKEQEYLFYYMATLLGCDVMLFNNRADLTGPEMLTALSCVIRLGSYGRTVIPGYVPQPAQRKQEPVPSPEKREPASAPASGKRPGMQPPGRPSSAPARTAAPAPETVRNPPAAGAAPVFIPAPEPPSLRRRTPEPISPYGNAPEQEERSFEELARLASSVVMIGLVDRSGNVVGSGSGIMIGRRGLILTNHHVAAAGKLFVVRIEDDPKPYATVEVVKSHKEWDLAVIRIDRQLNPLPLYSGRKELVRGQKVVAIGSPLGLFNSVSDGIISGFRKINNVDMIQFTAPISHGSSGGAVLNMHGEIIGISKGGMDNGQNINLAVDYKTIAQFIRGLN